MTIEKQPAGDPVAPALRAQWDASDVSALWESSDGLPAKAAEKACHWPWQLMRPMMLETAKITTPSIVERRVLQFNSRTSGGAVTHATSGLLNAAMQALMPGERARPHRHSMHALRFVLEGRGAETLVEGKACAMEPGDLVSTPGWTWHEHHNRDGEPTIWIDILDAATQLALGVAEFQPGPISDMAGSVDDTAFAVANFVPTIDRGAPKAFSPVFRYARADAVRAVAGAPAASDGSRRVRYANPLDGGSILPTIDCYLLELDRDRPTTRARSTASSICIVVDGTGTTTVNDQQISWARNDVFTLPQHSWVSHTASTGTARLFVATNRELYLRLGMLVEDYAEGAD